MLENGLFFPALPCMTAFLTPPLGEPVRIFPQNTREIWGYGYHGENFVVLTSTVLTDPPV